MAQILVVDDDKITRKTLGRVLQGDGYHVVFAADGERALSLLEDNPHIDLILTDVIMPNLDGRELVAAIRERQALAEIPTLIMSATVKVREIRALLETGAGRFLAKPVEPERLLEEVGASLHHSRRDPGTGT